MTEFINLALYFNFNPRSHEGSDYYITYTVNVPRISIHAPTKGATTFHPLIVFYAKFQSTLPRRERLRFWSHFIPYSTISIHAPTKGATNIPDTIICKYCLFQSTLPRRERHKRVERLYFQCPFQSTLPRRERLLHIARRCS